MRASRRLVPVLSILFLLAPLSARPAKKAVPDAAPPSRMTSETFAGLELRGIGPALMSGRIADVAIDPRDRSTWYVAVGSGGVWKTVNAGTTWTPLFDAQASYSIGCVTLDPSRPDTVWVGTGENVGGRHVGYGDGVYRSLDGGKTWENMGLSRSEHIGNIVVHPENSDVVYVAAQGPLWSKGGDRGLFKTEDGGKTWTKLLGDDEYTGVNEVRMDPRDPDVLYAATHQRFRNVAALMNGGPGSGIHKSTDGGKTWRRLTAGLPEEPMGKIGLAISPQEPDVVYAAIELAQRTGGFYRSTDGGESWEKRSDRVAGGTGPHYYQEIFASPHAFDRVYHTDVWLQVTDDGGTTFRPVGEKNKHSDNHAMAFVADDPDYLLVGCDGGLYETFDLGKTWKFHANLPVTQFYKVAVDYDTPFYNVYGGTQDNNTQGGPSRTAAVNGIRNADWFVTLFGDGHQPAVDPTDPDIVYSEWQQGNLVRYDRRTGEMVYIQPQPGADEPLERFNWDAPILISPHDPARLYFASQRVWRSDDRGDSWTPVSGDLSRGRDRLTLPLMGRVWSWDSHWDLFAMSEYGTVTSLAESPVVQGLLYAGTDDGLVQVSEDGGATWRRIDRLPGVADGFFVNDIKADLHDADTVYVVVDRHKDGDFSPYVLKSADRGRTWTSVRGDLPDRHLVWRIVQDHVDPRLLFAGTEFGVFFTIDGGTRWIELTGGVPTIPFRDLAIQRRENDLVGATFGRGFFVFDDYTPLRGLSADALEREAVLFPVRDAPWYVERRPLGGADKASQGDAYFTAPNPPFGAVFTYYLRDGLRTRKEARREAEKPIAAEGGDTPTPGWDALRAEAEEVDPAIVLTVRDADGNVVRRIEGPAKPGFHRVAWDLRYASQVPWTPRKSEDDWLPPFAAMAAPGRYTVSMATRVDGVWTDLGASESFDVVPWRDPALPGATPADAVAFQKRLAELDREVQGAGKSIDETAARLKAIRETLIRSATAGTDLDERVRALERRVSDLRLALSGDPRRDVVNAGGPVPITRRVQVAMMGTRYSLSGPTPTHVRSLDIAAERFAAVDRDLRRLVDVDLPALERDLDAAGVPWTPGR